MVSIKDVANKAGVAISTVSKVLNHYPNISESTQKKVNEAIEELGFVPNMAASMLSSKQPRRIALLINPYRETQAVDEINMQYILGAINKAKELSLDIITVFFSMIQDMSLKEVSSYLKAQNIVGLIICSMDENNTLLKELIDTQEFKIVVIDAPMYNKATSSVWIDNPKAQYEVAKKTALENDCESILYIAGKKERYITNSRLQGIEKLAKDEKMDLKVVYGDYSELKARELTLKYAKDWDIVACASDLMAIGAMKALVEMDIFRPVCGFDGIALMGYVGKQMNTVKQNFSKVANRAVEELARLLNEEEGRNVVLDYELVRMRYEDIIC